MNTKTNPSAAVSASADGLRVVLSRHGEWRGTFADFVQRNEGGLTLLEIQEAADTIMSGRPWTYGGHAGPVFTLRRDDSSTGAL